MHVYTYDTNHDYRKQMVREMFVVFLLSVSLVESELGKNRKIVNLRINHIVFIFRDSQTDPLVG